MIDDALWPAEQLGEAAETLARAAGLTRADHHVPRVPLALVERGGEALDRWLDAAVHPLGLEAEPTFTTYDEVARFVGRAAPAVLRIERDDEVAFALLLRGGRREVTLLGPDQLPVKVSAAELGERLAQPVVGPLAGPVDRLLASAGWPSDAAIEHADSSSGGRCACRCGAPG